MEKKAAGSNLQRNIERIKTELEAMGYSYHNPLGEKWDETRTDCEASISGTVKSKMTIAAVVKPLILQGEGSNRKIVQKAIVIVE